MKNHIAPNNDNNIPNKVNVFSEVSPVLGKILDEVSSIFIFSVFPLILLFRTILFELYQMNQYQELMVLAFPKQ